MPPQEEAVKRYANAVRYSRPSQLPDGRPEHINRGVFGIRPMATRMSLPLSKDVPVVVVRIIRTAWPDAPTTCLTSAFKRTLMPRRRISRSISVAAFSSRVIDRRGIGWSETEVTNLDKALRQHLQEEPA